MSSLVSGVTKLFTSIGSGVAKLGTAFKGIGASVFTAGAATGTGSSALGGMFGGNSILGNIFNGVASLFGGGAGASELGGGVLGGAFPAAPSLGATSATGAAGAGGFQGLASGIFDWAKSEGGAGAIAGLGAGIGKYQELKSIEDMQKTNLAYLQKQQDDTTAGYTLDYAGTLGGSEPRKRTPTSRIKIPQVATYDPNDGMIKMTTA